MKKLSFVWVFILFMGISWGMPLAPTGLGIQGGFLAWGYTETFYLRNNGDGSAPETIAGAWDLADVANSSNWDTDDQDDGKIGPNDRLIVLGDDGPIKGGLYLYQKSGLSGKPITIQGEDDGTAAFWNSQTKHETWHWTNESGNLWYASESIAVANMIMDNENAIGVRRQNKFELDVQGEFWYDDPNDRVYLYSVGNPATYYNGWIECAKEKTGIEVRESDHIVVENISFKYIGVHAIHIISSDDVVIKHNNVSYIGGAYVPGEEPKRYGNGIEASQSSTNILVEYNEVNQVWDAGLSFQGTDSGTAGPLYFKGNLVSNCEYGFETFYNGTISGLYVENNTFQNLGGSWGHDYRTDGNRAAGIHASHITGATDVYFRYNIIEGTTSSLAFINNLNGIVLDF